MKIGVSITCRFKNDLLTIFCKVEKSCEIESSCSCLSSHIYIELCVLFSSDLNYKDFLKRKM